MALVASVLYGTGAHWAVLQTGAWAGMIAASARESSLAESITSAFSGEKPCRMCKVVEKGSAAEQGPTLVRSTLSVELIVTDFARVDDVLPVSVPSVDPLRPEYSATSRPFVPPPKPSLPA